MGRRSAPALTLGASPLAVGSGGEDRAKIGGPFCFSATLTELRRK